MKPLNDIPRLTAASAALEDAKRFTASGHHAIARERLETCVLMLMRAAGLGQSELGLVEVLLDAAKSAGRSDFDAAHEDGRILTLSDVESYFDHERDLRTTEAP